MGHFDDDEFADRVHDENGNPLRDGDRLGDDLDFEADEPDYGDDVSLGFDEDERASRSLNGDPVIDDDESLDGSRYDDDDTLDGSRYDDEDAFGTDRHDY